MKRSVLASACAVAAFFVAGCTQTPGTPSVSFASPPGAGPSNGTSFKYSAQPLTLAISNVVRTSPSPATYTLEVASDAGFSNIVFTKADIAEGDGSTTSVQISTLAGNTTYHWRTTATVDGVAGVPSPARSFQVQQQVILGIPALATPASGGAVNEDRPTFRVNNSTKTGPAGTVFYEFQVSTSSNFGSITTSGTVQEQGGGQTSFTSPIDLPAGNYFWRAQASDPSNDVKSGFSGGSGFNLEPFNMRNAIIWNNPQDLGSWAETSKVTLVDTTGGAIIVDFDKRSGPDQWPEVSFGDGSNGTIQYVLGMCAKLGAKWHCSAVIQFWAGRDLNEGGHPNLIFADWFYDSRWGDLNGFQPKNGETVGIFAVNGNVRDSLHWAKEQRTNVQMVPWRTLWKQ